MHHLKERQLEEVYNFNINYDQDLDGRWSAWLTSHPACGSWGDTKNEAAQALLEMTVVFLEVMQDSGEPVYADSVENDDAFKRVVVESVDFDSMATVGSQTIRVPTAV